MGLDNPKNKMAKSAPSPNNYVSLLDSPDIIREKIKKAVTDSGKEVISSPKKPALSNLLNIYAGFSGKSVPEAEKRFAGRGYADFKKELAEVVISDLTPFQKKFHQLRQGDTILQQILRNGAAAADRIAKDTLGKVKQKMGLI